MGIICSTRKYDVQEVLKARISPFGKVRRKGLQCNTFRSCDLDPTSLLSFSLDALVDCMKKIRCPAPLHKLPPDLAQLLLDRLLEGGGLNEDTLPYLSGLHFYQLRLDAYPAAITEAWIRILVTQTLEVAVLSRTQINDFGLGAFPQLNLLHTLHLDCCDRITDGGLVVLNRLPQLKELSMTSCDGLGPLAMGAIGKLTNLKRLNMNACHRIWGLGPLRQLAPSLENLDVGWCNAIGDEDAPAIAALTNLKELRISRTRVTGNGIRLLTSLTNLRALTISGLRVKDAEVASLISSFHFLRHFDAERCRFVGDVTLRALSASKYASTLEELCLSYTAVTDDGLLTALPKLSQLQSLQLESCHIGDSGVECIATHLPNLRVLDVSDTVVGSSGVAALGKMCSLEEVDLSFNEIADWGLERLSRCSSLRRVKLDSRHIGDSGVAYVAALPNLEVLDLFGATVSDIGCARLATCTSLLSLEVCSGMVTDAGVRHLTALRKLKHLSLSQNWRVSNSAIPSLLQLSSLTALNLSQCRITSSAVVALGCLQELQVLALAGTKVDGAAVAKLSSIKPDLEVRGIPLSMPIGRH